MSGKRGEKLRSGEFLLILVIILFITLLDQFKFFVRVCFSMIQVHFDEFAVALKSMEA